MSAATRTRKLATRSNVALLYVRVSTSMQAESGLSLEQQERTLREAAAAAGYAEARVIVEAGVSGKSLHQRPAMTEALALLANGEASALYVTKLDRLARNTRDTLTVVDLADRQGWRLVALDLSLDSATPVGRMVLTLLASFAEMERHRIGERHREWHAAQAARGEIWGADKGPKPEVDSALVDRMAAEFAAGHSLNSIAIRLNAEQVPTARGGKWHAATVSRMINAPSRRKVAA